jgi:hypothetical protein
VFLNFDLPPGSVAAFGNLPLSSAIAANGHTAATQARQLLNFQTFEHSVPSFIVQDGSVMSNLFYSCRNSAFEMIGNDVAISYVLGLVGCYDLELFFRNRTPLDTYGADSWAYEIFKQIPKLDIYVLLACGVLYSGYMRVNKCLCTTTRFFLMANR